MTSIIDELGNHLSPQRIHDEGLTAFDIDEMSYGTSPEEQLEALEDEAYDAWEQENLYCRHVPPFNEFLKKYKQSL